MTTNIFDLGFGLAPLYQCGPKKLGYPTSAESSKVLEFAFHAFCEASSPNSFSGCDALIEQLLATFHSNFSLTCSVAVCPVCLILTWSNKDNEEEEEEMEKMHVEPMGLG